MALRDLQDDRRDTGQAKRRGRSRQSLEAASLQPRLWTCTACGFSERAPNESGAVDAYRLHIEEGECH
jgi:hypothetical protein